MKPSLHTALLRVCCPGLLLHGDPLLHLLAAYGGAPGPLLSSTTQHVVLTPTCLIYLPLLTWEAENFNSGRKGGGGGGTEGRAEVLYYLFILAHSNFVFPF